MRLRKLGKQVSLAGQRVLFRFDGNVPIEKGRAVDGPHGRIARAAVDLDWLIQRGARVVAMTHLGRPDGKRRSAYSLKPVAKRLSSLLGIKVPVSSALTGSRVERLVSSLKNGQVLLLENLRFDPREEKNDKTFAQELARLGDLYVNDAFAVNHRAHTSVQALAQELPAYAGFLLENEIAVLSQSIERARHPFVLVMGGLKVETKLPVMEHLAAQVDVILVGGALATTFAVADGKAVGRSVYDKEAVEVIRYLSKSLRQKILLPEDVVVASSLRKDAKTHVALADQVGAKDRIVDIGPKTIARFEQEIKRAKMVVWNGPLGYCEIGAFCRGSEKIAQAIAHRTGAATTIVGGGDTGPVLERLKLADRFTLLSTGGGAMLDFLAGHSLPGLEPLER
ncbi:phosphoglycerate kinase [Candidatus Uhrbacteria bacterium]|nr:phosphoglycerate kinase [Candidatus Uhrbacteria bacterium]